MNMPGFRAETALSSSGKYCGRMSHSHSANGGRVVPASRMTCAFKACRFAGRCLGLGLDHQSCMETAADFFQFCNEYDL